MGTLKGTQGSVLVPKSHCLPPPEPVLSPNPTARILNLLQDKNNKPMCPVFPPPRSLVWLARPCASLTTEEGTVHMGFRPSRGVFETHTLKPWLTSASVLTVLS